MNKYILAALCVLIAAPAVLYAQDDDYIKELMKKKKRDKAIKEGKDPDAVEEKEVVSKPKLPTSASGWIGTIKRCWDSDKVNDIELYNKSVESLKSAIGDDADLQSKVIKAFDGFKEKEAERRLASAIKSSGASVDRLEGVLKKHRPNALKAIMNPAYTESDGCRLQPEVDAACKPLFDVWRNPLGYAVENWKLDITTPASQLDTLCTNLEQIAPGMGAWPEGIESASAYMEKAALAQLDVKKKYYTANKGTLNFNANLKGGTLTDEDKAHVLELNDYRMMLGRGCLKINLQLCKACTGHSKYMNKIKKLAHNIQGHPDGVTPQDRAKRAGFGGGVAENCLVGASDGKSAVWQWYNAAEHHRNMIGGHSIIGVGHDGTYWTQNFAGGGRRGR
ncbi:MAG: CAP domain-containing protein [Planctomycetota bacterium]